MALYLLNISIDTADITPFYLPEDLTVNDQESIIELVVEKVLGFENAIEEHDDPDSQDHNEKNINKIDLIIHNYSENNFVNFPCAKELHVRYKWFSLKKGYYLLFTPPPQTGLFV